MNTREIRVDVAAMHQAHETLAGARTALARALDEAQAGDGAVLILPIVADTVHRIEGIALLAADRGIQLRLDLGTAPLSERDAAFLADFVKHRMPPPTSPSQSLNHVLREGTSVMGELLSVGRHARPARVVAIPPSRRLPRIVLIGAYGGDHVGDAAILGGVLHHLHATYGTTDATVLSFRPEHTRRLANGLQTPVRLTVGAYDAATTRRSLDQADALMIAGGPLMDLPRILVKHLAAVGMATTRGIPFLIERVGVGPFKRSASRWAARHIARSAARISVRTNGAAADPVLAGLNVTVGRDPAFDYLATRRTTSLATAGELASIDTLLGGTQGRLLVGLNLRPIRHLWSTRGEDYSRSTEGRFFERLTAALIAFSRASVRPVTYVFFPMNPIQFGASDLASAFRLHQLVAGAADLRVWEADPDVDGVVALLRRLDIAITMRFHACIFALAQGMPVLGVDYYPGRGGKVEELFTDLGRAEDVRRIDTLETDWLIERLQDCVTRLVPDA